MAQKHHRNSTFSAREKFGLALGPLLFILTMALISPGDPAAGGMSAGARGVLAGTLWIAVWWITEAIPIAATSLLPIILFPLTGGLDIHATTKAYGHPMIFLFIGGFMIAVAIERWHLHRRIAMKIIAAMGTKSSRIILGFMLATALLSMWISNTATAMMMMPIGLAIVDQLNAFQAQQNENSGFHPTVFGKALMLSIAYAASIGGMATLIGTPPNLVFLGIVKQLYNVEISFVQWMYFGLPISVVLLMICWIYLVRFAFPIRQQQIPGSQAEMARQLAALGKMTREERRVLIIFGLTALAWITRSFILSKFIPGINDTVIAISGALSLFLISAPNQPGEKLLDWESAVRLPWGIVLLFGGGLAIAAGFKTSGLAEWIGTQFHLLHGISFIIILLLVIAAINFLTEITSNTATATIILPILSALALAIDVHPFGLMIAATVAASCAFMLPVATPPNAVVFGGGKLEISDMVKAGVWMNFISIALLTLFVYFWLPLIWGIDLQVFPALLK